MKRTEETGDSARRQEEEERQKHGPRDDRFSDPEADEDPRTSDEGVTSAGATDLDADTTQVDTSSPESVPGVRHG